MMLGSSSLLNDSGAAGRLTVRQFVAQRNLCATGEKPDGGGFSLPRSGRFGKAAVGRRRQLARAVATLQSTVAAGRALEKQPFEA